MRLSRRDILRAHQGGKLDIRSRRPLRNRRDLSIAYTPGVARVSQHIHRHPPSVYDYTIKANTIAIVADGSKVLGLGDLGPHAALPVMEGKAVLFKELAGIDAFPLCILPRDVDSIVATVEAISPVFGAINIEDISAPRCFEVEEKLRRRLPIPVFHDDQHGTATVVLAGLLNALQLTDKDPARVHIAINGAGAAGIAMVPVLRRASIARHGTIRVCDTAGILHPGRRGNMNPYKERTARDTNPRGQRGTLADAMRDADIFIGVSRADCVTPRMVRSMAPDPILFALANPDPEIRPEQAHRAGARLIATGRSDYPNQINNMLAFPGIFRGALDARLPRITIPMEVAAAQALARLVPEGKLSPRHFIPDGFDPRVVPAVSRAVQKAA